MSALEALVAEPNYCAFYKKLLIEELIYYLHPLKAHYGKCSAIGKFVFIIDTQEFALERISLKYSPIANQTPRVFLINVPASFSPKVDSSCEVLGEFFFKPREQRADNLCTRLCTTTRDLYLQLQGNENPVAGLAEMDRRYEPVLMVHNICQVENPAQRISCDLMMRDLQLKCNSFLR